VIVAPPAALGTVTGSPAPFTLLVVEPFATTPAVRSTWYVAVVVPAVSCVAVV
jgi:hypothetical protein